MVVSHLVSVGNFIRFLVKVQSLIRFAMQIVNYSRIQGKLATKSDWKG